MMGSVFLAGPIVGLGYEEARRWRDSVQSALRADGIVCYSPLRGRKYLENYGVLTNRPYYDQPLSRPKAIIGCSLWDVMRSDVILANLGDNTLPAVGTIMEIAWAYLLRKPVVLVITAEAADHLHVTVEEASQFIVPTLEDAIAIIRVLVTQGGNA